MLICEKCGKPLSSKELDLSTEILHNLNHRNLITFIQKLNLDPLGPHTQLECVLYLCLNCTSTTLLKIIQSKTEHVWNSFINYLIALGQLKVHR